ncbi:hypothetical protein NDI45_03900 [Leptolyngbya sp. GB1-A1]|uniref:hypothetical protein n=1 Tax=Leptolyngbya sp. GB1-A1 TaxID=2933908 RepID=UPI00329771DB
MTQEPKSPSKAATLQRLLGQFSGIAQTVLAAGVKLGGNLLRSAGKLWWNTILPFVQGLLPAPWNRRLSKPVLTGITIALLTLLLWLASTLSRPAVSSVEEPPTSSQELRAPESRASRPEPALSPEKLIRLQEKLAQVTESYGEAFILSVQPGVRHHLTLTLGDRWYSLPAETQDQLARELWERSRQFDFTQLEILDLEDQRIARSPVVGQQMLILKRSGRLPVIEPQSSEGVEPSPELAPADVLEPVLEPALEPETPFLESPDL